MRKSLYIGVLGVAACASAMSREARNPVIADNDQPVRIALATGDESAKVGGTGSWRIYRSNSSNLVARGTAGETMLVHGASGGVGIAAVQLGAALGMRVYGTAGTEDGRRLVVEQGAEQALDHGSASYLE